MPKYCYNYDTGDYEWIDEDGYSYNSGEYLYNWDSSEYERDKHNEDDEDDD